MNAIVTGGCGFIGYNLTQRLQSDGHTVTVIDNLSSGYRSNHVDKVDYHYISIQKGIDQLVEMLKPDVIFHFAAIPRVTYSVEYPLKTTEENVIMTVQLLDAVRRVSPATRIVYSSSSSIYGGMAGLPTKESSPAAPQSPYAMQKWQGEEWVKLFANLYGLNAVILRYFNVFGPHSRYGGAYSTVLSAWLYSTYVDQTVKPYLEGDGTQSRDFCFVDNVVDANLAAADQGRIDPFRGEAYNIAQGQQHTLLDCKQIIEDISGKKLDLEIRDPRVGDVPHTLADITLAGRVLGYDPSSDFKNQLEQMAKWYETDYPVA